MNLFKILANGYGSVNENNVSAFFAYLADPNENHSLDNQFIQKFINSIIKDDFNVNNYEVKIYLEQSFGEEGKDRVDIVILFYNSNEGENSQTQMESFIRNERKVEKVILIENKIKKSAIKPNQVTNQIESAKTRLNISEEDIYSVYLTPNDEIFKSEFKKLKHNNLVHYFWHLENKTEISVTGILSEILKADVNCENDPISDYTKQTLKAFIQFVKSDFKSEKKIKDERKFKKDIYNSFEELIKTNQNLLCKESEIIAKELIKYIKSLEIDELKFRCSKTHPVSIFYKTKKIFGLNKNKEKLYYDFIYRNFNKIKNLDEEIKNNFCFVLYHNNNENIGIRVKPKTNKIEEITIFIDKIIELIKN